MEAEAPVWSLQLEVGLAVELNLFQKNEIVLVLFVLQFGGWVGGGIKLQAKSSCKSFQISQVV